MVTTSKLFNNFTKFDILQGENVASKRSPPCNKVEETRKVSVVGES